ncbi:MAG: hypothetical protein A2Y25_01010 [Candidatus Melainabacteria bacterium GWF2_37_15]|nr:MAG: hypothetical protein A2Y25_01010 [Candidatus Melainabacteria bacterium GWF2_37_15]
MKNLAKKLFFIANVLCICTFISFVVSANQNDALPELKMQKTEKTEKTEKVSIVGNNEEKVVISIVNFGRKNPFEPYKEVKKGNKEKSDLDDIPYPPSLETGTGDEFRILMGARVSGILYDPEAKSVAILNMDDSEYMVHEGDSIHGLIVEDISKNNVTLKYGSNSYTVGVGLGETVKGEGSIESIQSDPVIRKEKIFAQKANKLPDLELEELINR